MKKSPIFETNNLDLAAFLLFEGIKFLELTKSETNPKQVIIRFLDTKTSCLDLERVFLSSDIKRYKDLHKYLLKEIHKFIRENNE